MAFGKNTPQSNNNANEPVPKKADMILKANYDIAVKQDDLIRQTKLSNSRMDAALELFRKNMQESAQQAKQTHDLIVQLQNENTALKQELLYLAKQSENIYAGLAEKINDLTEQARKRENAYASLADKVNDLSEQNKHSERAYVEINDKITELSEQSRRNEGDYSELLLRLNEISDRTKTAEEAYVTVGDKLDDYAEQNKRVEASYQELSDKMTTIAEETRRAENTYADLAFKIADISEQTKRAGDEYTELSEKITDVSEHTRRSENVYLELTDKIDSLSGRVERLSEESIRATSLVSATASAPVQAIPAVAAVSADVDYDKLAQKVADLVSAREFISPDLIASKVAEQVIIPESAGGKAVSIDEEKIAQEVVSRINLHFNDEGKEVAVNLNVDLDEDKIARNVLAGINVGLAEDRPATVDSVNVEIDEEKIARLISDNVNINLDEDRIARIISDNVNIDLNEETIARIVTDNVNVDLNEEYIANRVADMLIEKGVNAATDTEAAVTTALPVDIDEEELAERIASKLGTVKSDLPVEIDEEELADRIALKVGSLKAEDFEIIVDDEGCDSISKEIADKLDYAAISEAVAEKLRYALDLADANEPDYEEMAQRISEKITVAGINEDAIADKAAAVLSNYLPDFDTDEIADKVMNAVIDVLNAQLSSMTMPAVDTEAICNNITDKIIESQADHDYDIVLDEDGITKFTELVTEGIENNTEQRFAQVEDKITEIKELLESGAIVASAPVVEVAAAQVAYEPEPEEEEPLVTVSDLIEQPVEEPEEDKIEKDIDDSDDDDEAMPGMEQDGTDFSNMMKYNRSFIARIIQSSDDYKNYYGAVKQALLSYKKVNSNIAWGAERFNKGRDTIARIKIRGKTLCLYLALDPNEYKTSVYHHLDATDNKSMAGTPMMVKIKSALGVKKAIRLIDEMLGNLGAEKRYIPERDYAAMYPYETIEELIEEGIVKDVRKNKK